MTDLEVNSKFFSILFKEGEATCVGSMYDKDVKSICLEPGPEFFCVNPLDPLADHVHFLKDHYKADVGRRADMNVSAYRNFVFEMDSMPITDQKKIFEECRIPFSTLVFSGSKSVHAILSLDHGLDLQPHRLESIMEYKRVWERLVAAIDWDAKAMGYVLPDGKPSFIDSACKNPSRFTRFPNSIRPKKGTLQEVIKLGKSMSQGDFDKLLDDCPRVFKSVPYETLKPEKEIVTENDFWACCPIPLARALKNVDWAGRDGMYPLLYKFTLWAVDSTGVTKELFYDILEKYTFPRLVAGGYPIYKLTKPVDHAFSAKGVY